MIRQRTGNVQVTPTNSENNMGTTKAIFRRIDDRLVKIEGDDRLMEIEGTSKTQC